MISVTEKLRRTFIRLSLFGWPPVASHLTCFLVGLGMAQLPGGASASASGATGGGKAGPARSAVLSLPESVGTPPEARPLRPGDDVFLTRTEGTTPCLITTPSLRVEARAPRLAVRFIVGKAGDLNALGRALLEPGVSVVRQEAATGWTPCERQARVTYGSP